MRKLEASLFLRPKAQFCMHVFANWLSAPAIFVISAAILVDTVKYESAYLAPIIVATIGYVGFSIFMIMTVNAVEVLIDDLKAINKSRRSTAFRLLRDVPLESLYRAFVQTMDTRYPLLINNEADNAYIGPLFSLSNGAKALDRDVLAATFCSWLKLVDMRIAISGNQLSLSNLICERLHDNFAPEAIRIFGIKGAKEFAARVADMRCEGLQMRFRNEVNAAAISAERDRKADERAQSVDEAIREGMKAFGKKHTR